MKTRIGSRGFTLIEITLVLALIAVAIVWGLWYAGKASQRENSVNTVQAINKIVLATRALYRTSGSYNQLTVATLGNTMGIPPPFKWNGTNMTDPWGAAVQVSGNAAGATPSFVITIGAGPASMSIDECVAIGSGLAGVADTIYVDVGTQPMSSTGRLLGGQIYKNSTFGTVPHMLLGACSQGNPGLGFQFN